MLSFVPNQISWKMDSFLNIQIEKIHTFFNVYVFDYRLYFIVLLHFSQSKDTIDPGVLWKSSLLFSLVFCLVLSSCEIGQRLTNAFGEVSYKFEQLDLYLLPAEIQRILPTILIGVQKPIVFECFGIVDGSREQFKRVMPRRWELIIWCVLLAERLCGE